MERRLPWFVRLGDRLVDRHERWVREYRDSGDYYLNLLRYANERDEAARAWLAEALSRVDYFAASRFWIYYVIAVFPIGFFLVTGLLLKGCAIVIALLLLIPLFVRFDRWNRRRKAWLGLAEGEALIYTKAEVKAPPEGSRIFQSYWSMPDSEHRLELDHPIEMLDILETSNEFWQWRMPVPRENSGRVTMGITHMDVGLVRRDENGRRKLLAGGVVYYPYDPWSGRIDTG